MPKVSVVEIEIALRVVIKHHGYGRIPQTLIFSDGKHLHIPWMDTTVWYL